MHRPAAGFTLLEVLVALFLVTVGLLGFAGTLRPIASLAGQGRARGHAALQLTSRLSALRSELLAKAPACVVPVSGSEQHKSGSTESWSATLDTPLVLVRLTVSTPVSHGVIADTLFTRIPCP